MRLIAGFAGFLCATLLMVLPSLSWAENRVALVLGNAAYAQIEPLENPVNDATDISVALEGLGFKVFLGRDQGREDMLLLIDQFLAVAQTADVALFYYAGHGFQAFSQNYLVPTDAQITGPQDVVVATIPLQTVMQGMETAQGIKFVILDACRNNPFGETLKRTDVSEGLARVGNAADFMISFATQPDNVAYDGVGRNSFFTESLLSHLYTPGQDVSDLMISVRRDVLAATGGRQIPWENSSLTRQFQFDSRPITVSPETLLWQVAAEARDPELLQLYAARYPQGAHLGDVMAYLDTEATRTTSGTASAQNNETRQGSAQGDRLWELAQRNRMRPLVQLYLDQHPNGRHVAAARRLIDTLPKQQESSPGRLCERLATHPHDATATTAGIPFAQLRQNTLTAIEACQTAAHHFPELPHYTALLARATMAAGDQPQAIALYRAAADRGDLRAMVSLGQITEAGLGVSPDFIAALAYYRQAAEGGSADGMINLAVSLFEGVGVDKDPGRAIELLKKAADNGSPIATYNLGVLAQDGTTDTPDDALSYFIRAANAGEARGYFSAAILLDEGRGVTRDPKAAANLLLRGGAEDNGHIVAQLSEKSADWSRPTIAAIQERLKAAGHYSSTIDGLGGPNFTAALKAWRNGGFNADVLTQ